MSCAIFLLWIYMYYLLAPKHSGTLVLIKEMINNVRILMKGLGFRSLSMRTFRTLYQKLFLAKAIKSQ
jgi:hypothetical protein